MTNKFVQLVLPKRGNGDRRVLNGLFAQRCCHDDSFDTLRLRCLRRRRGLGNLGILRLRVGNIRESRQRTSRGSAHNQLANLHFIPLRFLSDHRLRIEPVLSANTSEANYPEIASQANYPGKPKLCVALKAKRPKIVCLSINIWGLHKLDLPPALAILFWGDANWADASVNKPVMKC